MCSGAGGYLSISGDSDIAERMGLTDAIERLGYHMREMRIVDEGGRRIAGFGTRVFLKRKKG